MTPDEAVAPDPARRAELAAALDRLERRVAAACSAAGRERAEVTLVAVTKFHPAADVAALHALGVRDVGESRAQEAAGKHDELPELDLRWHMLGAVQRNKARGVAAWADLVHSLDSTRLSDALADGADRAGRRLDVLLQVSLDGDPERGGASTEQVLPLAEHVVTAPGLRLRGLMAVAPLAAEPARSFAHLAGLSEAVRREHPQAVLISAGMSADLEAAVQAGSTHLRVGTALLGPRPQPAR